jgi:hypothetical protein
MSDDLWGQVESGAQPETAQTPPDDLWDRVEKGITQKPPSALGPVLGQATAGFTPTAAPAWMMEGDRPLQGAGTAAVNSASAALDAPGHALTNFAVKHGAPTYLAAGLGTIPDVVEDYLLGGRGAIRGVTGIATGADKSFAKQTAQIEEGHPLTEAANASQAQIEGYRQEAKAAGVEITDRQITPAQRFLNNSAAEDLRLPKNSPITSDLIDAGIKENVSPAWDAVRGTPEYQLGPKYQAAMKGVDVSKIDPEWQPPADGTMTGARAADLSTQLRSVARQEFGDASNPNFTTAQRNAARASAQAHYSAAKAVEGGFRENAEATGTVPIADAWDSARVYQAKAEAWRDTIDGAGNVIGNKIKKIGLSDEPITGPMKRAASVAASDQELFRSSRIGTPQPGLLRKTAAAAAPALGAAIGGSLASGHGAVGGEMAGAYVADKIMGR